MLGDAEQCFLILEKSPQDAPTIEKIFRIAHNIKGSAKAVGFDGLGAFTHELETFLLKCKSGEIPIEPRCISLLLRCTDHVRLYVDTLKGDLSANIESSQLVAEIKAFTPGSVTSTAAPALDPATAHMPLPPSQASASASAPVEDMPANVPLKAPPESKAKPEAKSDARPSSANQGEESIRVSGSRLEKLLNFVGEMVILNTVLRELSSGQDPEGLRKTVHQMGKVTKEIQDLSMSLRMVPLKQTFQKMQRIVRDTSALLGKKVDLLIEGEETEVDKTVLESLGDPLVHLIRNAVDHGIESAEKRAAAGKSETGQVRLRAFHESGKLVIEVSDDGGGIPADVLRRKALEKGILRDGQTLSDQQAIELIFHPGFSTKSEVTEVSGRGVGMDVVKTNIEQLSGEIRVETLLGTGTTFRVILPLTLAIIDGMVVRAAEDRFVVPLAHVYETVRTSERDLRQTTGLGEVLLLRGESLPVMRLSQILGKRASASTQQGVLSAQIESDAIALVIRTKAQPFAVLVDDIVGQHQVVIKKLGAEYQRIPGYSGSAILGDGKPALILEMGELAEYRGRIGSSQQKARAAA